MEQIIVLVEKERSKMKKKGTRKGEEEIQRKQEPKKKRNARIKIQQNQKGWRKDKKEKKMSWGGDLQLKDSRLLVSASSLLLPNTTVTTLCPPNHKDSLSVKNSCFVRPVTKLWGSALTRLFMCWLRKSKKMRYELWISTQCLLRIDQSLSHPVPLHQFSNLWQPHTCTPTQTEWKSYQCLAFWLGIGFISRTLTKSFARPPGQAHYEAKSPAPLLLKAFRCSRQSVDSKAVAQLY